MINIFLKALESRLGKSNKYFLVKEATLPTRFPAYKNFKQSVYAKTSSKYEIISEVDKNTLVDDIDGCKAEVTQKNIENILKQYGV